MSVTQIVEVPANHRLTIDVPSEIPAGRTILTFIPASVEAEASSEDADSADGGLDAAGECPICAAHRDPVTGEERFNAETVAAFKEGDAMLRGEKPATWHNSLEDLDKMLGL
jgi:hypothetical protein